MTEQRTVWFAYSSISDDPPTSIGVAATETGAWQLCENAARFDVPDGDHFLRLQYNERYGHRWAWAEFANEGIRKWRAFMVTELPFTDE